MLRNCSAWYAQAFLDTPAAQEALAGLGLTDISIFSDFRIGFCNGTLRETLPKKGEVRSSLKTAGIITKDGKEFFEGCLVFPWFGEEDECLGMWGFDTATAKGDTFPGTWWACTTSRR